MHGFMLAEGRNTVNTRQDGLGGDIFLFFFISNDEVFSSPTMRYQRESPIQPCLQYFLFLTRCRFERVGRVMKYGIGGEGRIFRY